jgi:hypothetical protein
MNILEEHLEEVATVPLHLTWQENQAYLPA